jgi:hypothetical protein
VKFFACMTAFIEPNESPLGTSTGSETSLKKLGNNVLSIDCFLEVKSRTWSRRDAQDKATIITELLERLGAGANEIIDNDYVDL